jgi:hypothetical protein
MRGVSKNSLRRALFSLLVALSAVSTQAQVRHHVPSRPETVVWGHIPIERSPVMTIRSGEIVSLDTL